MLDNKQKILEVFPELASSFTEAENELAKPGCVGCRRGRVLRKLQSQYRDAIKSYPERDITSLPIVPDRVHITENKAGNAPFQRMPVRRKACKECVLKHLASAYALNSEIANGYPEYIERASSELEQAYSMAPAEQRAKLYPAICSYFQVRQERGLEWLKRAHQTIGETLDTFGPGPWYRIIGQLVQAEEECWGYNPALSGRIRDERLKLMNDQTYRPDMPALLGSIKPEDRA